MVPVEETESKNEPKYSLCDRQQFEHGASSSISPVEDTKLVLVINLSSQMPLKVTLLGPFHGYRKRSPERVNIGWCRETVTVL